MIKLGLVQASSRGSIAENLQTLASMAQNAARSGCDAVCFPECFLTGYHPERASAEAISADSIFLTQVVGLARQYQLDILTGFMERDENALYITQGIFQRNGETKFYRKTHLGVKEANFFSAGNVLEVFSLSCGLRIGFQLCVETHYPEITQTLALKGAEVIFAPHAVPRVTGERKALWGKYIPARSYDNRIYMLCCNLWDASCFAGGCLVTDPNGDVAEACFENGEHLVVAEIDRALVARFRTQGEKPSGRFFPSGRRPELYSLL